jgi:hypothetical protein
VFRPFALLEYSALSARFKKLSRLSSLLNSVTPMLTVTVGILKVPDVSIFSRSFLAVSIVCFKSVSVQMIKNSSPPQRLIRASSKS